MTNDSSNEGRHLVADAVGVLGRTLIVLGLLLLAFVGYQLWGTSLEESRAQSALAESFAEQVKQSEGSVPDTSVPNATTPSTSLNTNYPEKAIKGRAIGRISIPKIGVSKWLVAGVDWNSLKKGPGVYLDGPMPGQKGNAAIAGHRTTFGAPFERIDELTTGDLITIETREGTFGYVVSSTTIVRPNDLSVLEPDPNVESSITLISCTPKYTASKRLIVRANIAPDTPTAAQPATPLINSINPEDAAVITSGPLVAGWFHDTGGVVPSVILGAVLFVIAMIPRVARRRWPSFVGRVGTLLVTAAIFLPTLYYFFQNVSRLVPTNL